MKTITRENYVEMLCGKRPAWQSRYYAFYSSLLGGVTLDPSLMQAPVDDHVVHRGDGVFDTFKSVNRGAYNLDAHLRRLVYSGETINLIWPGGEGEIRELALATLAAADRDDCACRVLLTRGPGSFGISPYDSPAPALYIVVYASAPPFMEQHPGGARARRSLVPAKPDVFATFKHCNYLPNVLMKREAVEGGVDFVIGFDERGCLAEGATENVAAVTGDGCLVFPRAGRVLEGTTMLRILELAEGLVAAGLLKAVVRRDLDEDALRAAKELLMVGTTINVTSVCEYEGRPIGSGAPGAVGRALDRLLQEDIETNAALRAAY